MTLQKISIARTSPFLLEVKDVSKKFGGITALDSCTMGIPEGKLVAIIGPNGSGKSTLFNVIMQLERQDSGTIVLDGLDVTGKKEYEIARMGISRTFQEVRLFRNLTIRQHIELVLDRDNELIIRSIFRKKEISTQQVKDILNLVGLFKPFDTCASDLSYGQRKLLDLALALAKPHYLVLLDEPVAGINPKLREDIKRVLVKLKQQKETIMLIEHDMNFVMSVADYIYVLDYGKVIASGTPDEIANNEKVLEAYLGI